MKEICATTLCEKRVLDQQWCQHCRPRKGNPYAWARKKELEDAQAAVRETLAQLRTVLEERDSYRRQLDAIGDAIVPALVQRIEPRLSRHPVTVIMAAGALIAKIGEAIGCEFTDGDDLLEAVKGLVRERDEARAEVREYREQLRKLPDANRIASQDAYRRGAEAMREACQQWCRAWENDGEAIADALADLRVEDKP